MQDLRLAVRALRATPIVTAVAILSLALGIGANTAIFSLINSLLLRTLPVADPERLANLGVGPALSYRPNYSYATFDQIRRHSDAFDGAIAYGNCCGKSTLKINGEMQAVDRQFVSGDFFTALGVRPLLGRMFIPGDDAPGGGPDGPVAVISYRLWQRFGGAASIIGAPLTIDRAATRIVGVMPPGFFGLEVGRAIDIAMPISTEPATLPSVAFDADIPWLNIMLRLKPGQSFEAATAALRAAQPQIRAGSMPHAFAVSDFLNEPFTLEPAGAGTSVFRQQFERPLLMIFVVVVFVLLIACANIANLQLARGIARQHELSLRLALGASRWQLARQLLIESLVLTTIGTTFGLLFAAWAGRALVAGLSTAATAVAIDLSLDWRVLAFTAGTMVVTTMLFGVAPALCATRVTPMEALKAHGRGVSGEMRINFGSSLIVAQVALSLMLVVAAGLFARTFARLSGAPLGFDRDRVVVVTVTAPTVAAADRNPFYKRLVSAVAAVPGVAQAGGSLNPPLIGFLVGDFVVSVPGTAAPPDAERISQSNEITPGWLAAYGTTIREGRDIDDHDTATRQPVMLVNEAFARRFSAGRPLVGTTLVVTLRDQSGDTPLGTQTIVGVVSDAVYRSIREPARPMMYTPLAQRGFPIFQTYFYIAVRSSSGSPALLTRSVARALTAINPDLTLTFRPVSDQVNESLAQDRLVATLSEFFGALALLLAALGLYGITAYAVARRHVEIGVRMALGAAPRLVMRLVLSRVLILVGTGVLIGVGASVWVSRFIAGLLYGVQPRDLTTFLGAVGVLAGVGTFAAWLPAWRASRIDPADVLRDN